VTGALRALSKMESITIGSIGPLVVGVAGRVGGFTIVSTITRPLSEQRRIVKRSHRESTLELKILSSKGSGGAVVGSFKVQAVVKRIVNKITFFMTYILSCILHL
jgi:hypothetical protein